MLFFELLRNIGNPPDQPHAKIYIDLSKKIQRQRHLAVGSTPRESLITLCPRAVQGLAAIATDTISR
jgi:hypothetical protein